MQCGAILVYTAGIHRLRELGDVGFENCLNCVPQWRRQRIQVYRNMDDRLRSLACSLLLVEGCAELGWDSQGYIGENGRPMLSGEGHYISLAHAGDYAAVAFSREPVGIDVEETRRFTLERMEKIGRKILTDKEKQYLYNLSHGRIGLVDCSDNLENVLSESGEIKSVDIALTEDVKKRREVSDFDKISNYDGTSSLVTPDCAQTVAFARIWTCKEAYAKRNGKGLSMDLREIETMQEDLFYSCALGEDYVISACGSNLANIREVCI